MEKLQSISAAAKAASRAERRSGRSPINDRPGVYTLFWIFVVASVLGYILEMLFWYFHNGYFESRKGLVYGPFSQVYGFGAVLLTLLLYRLRDKNPLVIFGVSAFAGAAFEYLCSLLQELALGTVSWQYSHAKYNIGGRTTLKYAFFWGVLGLVFIRFCYPLLCGAIERFPRRYGNWVAGALAVFLCFDILLSVAAIKRGTDRSEGLPPQTSFGQFLDRRFDDARMREIYPNMKVVPNK